MMSERRMDAYYYEFEPTKNVAIDKILGAVGCAGRAYHHTQNWCDIANQYDDHTGVTPIEWIQNAAFEAANEIERLCAREARLREALEKIASGELFQHAHDYARTALGEEKK